MLTKGTDDSLLVPKERDSEDLPTEFPMPDDDGIDQDLSNIPFDDDDDDGGDHEQRDASLVRLSGVDAGDSPAAHIGGLQDDDDGELNANNKRNTPATPSDSLASQPPAKRPRRKRRRKVVIDNHNMELTSEHIKAMIADTSDIVKRQLHPADDDDDDDQDPDTTHERKSPAKSTTTLRWSEWERSMIRPFLLDQGPPLPPVLEDLWSSSHYRVLNVPCSFQTQPSEDQPPQEDDDDDDNKSETPSAIELARGGGEEDVPPVDHDDEEEEDGDDEEGGPSVPPETEVEDGDDALPFMDDGDEEDAPPPADLLGDDEDEPRLSEFGHDMKGLGSTYCSRNHVCWPIGSCENITITHPRTYWMLRLFCS